VWTGVTQERLLAIVPDGDNSLPDAPLRTGGTKFNSNCCTGRTAAEVAAALQHGVAANNRTIRVVLLYMCLQAAATVLTRHDPTMQYSADVGVNSYVRVMLSFLHKQVSSSCLTIKFHSELFIHVIWL